MAQARGRALDQVVGQRLGRLGGEEAGVGVAQPLDLGMHRGDHRGMAVAEARDRRAARGVEVTPALVVDDEGAVAVPVPP
jgi:hypothetical protein